MASRHPKEQRRSSLRRFGIIVIALTLAGCESLLPRTAPPPTETAPPPQQEEVVIREGIPEDGRHRVALLVPTSGNNAGVGQSIANAANMAILDTGGEEVRIT
ncbi:MAG: penicillin-binding protein activator, partial [Sphingomonadales bacterium]|nr:penicillin-binding protein activator [Sphingomonadales bacterium]